jgi:hypothetical protein
MIRRCSHEKSRNPNQESRNPTQESKSLDSNPQNLLAEGLPEIRPRIQQESRIQKLSKKKKSAIPCGRMDFAGIQESKIYSKIFSNFGVCETNICLSSQIISKNPTASPSITWRV